MHKIDFFIGPTIILIFVLGLLWFFTNKQLYSMPEKRVLMKPTFGPSASKFVSYYGADKLKGDRSEAVQFRAPDNGKLCVGRVMAVAGSTVEIKDNKVIVNGETLEEPYLKSASCRPALAPIVVPNRTVFVLCDERNGKGANRYDSRYYGPIPIECITRILEVNTGSWRNK